MKKTLFVALLFVASIVFAKAEDEFEVTKVSVTSGKGATTSGLDASVTAQKDDQLVVLTGNADRVYFIYNYKYKPFCFSFGPTGGFFKNMPWLGLYAVFAPIDWLYFTHWSGWSAGAPLKPSIKQINSFLMLHSMSINWWRLQFSYTEMYFLGTEFSLPGISLTVPLSKKIKAAASVDYDLRAGAPYYNIGFIYLP